MEVRSSNQEKEKKKRKIGNLVVKRILNMMKIVFFLRGYLRIFYHFVDYMEVSLEEMDEKYTIIRIKEKEEKEKGG